MNPSSTPQPDDPLTRAITALRNAPTPPGPPAALAAATAEVAQRESQIIPFKERALTMLWKTRYPGIAAASLFVVTWLFLGDSNHAYAEMLENIRKIRSASYKIVFEANNSTEVALGRGYYLAPGLIRQDLPDGSIRVTDYSQNKAITPGCGFFIAKRRRFSFCQLAFTAGSSLPL